MCTEQLGDECQNYRVAYDLMSRDSRVIFDDWVQAACVESKEDGRDVVRNLRQESRLEPSILSRLLIYISSSFASNGASNSGNGLSARQAYEEACQRLRAERNHTIYCLGPEASVSNRTRVYRVLKLRSLKKMIAEAMGGTESGKNDLSDFRDQWDTFLQLLDDQDSELYCEILQKILPCRPDRIAWTYFNRAQNSVQRDIDPLFGKDCDHYLSQLGLPPDWYPRGRDRNDDQSSWRICYDLEGIAKHVPTIADTLHSGWNPYFQVSVDPRWGWTRPLGRPRGEQGLPEVVHRGWTHNEKAHLVSSPPIFLE